MTTMTTTVETRSTTAPTADAVLDAVHDLAPGIAARAPEIEQGRRVPADLLDSLIGAGCFGLVLPQSHGGTGASLPAMLRVLEALGRADGSVAWTVLIGAGSWCDLAGLPRATFDELFAGGRDAITAGVFNPSGTSTPVEGGYRITGRWAFASGCEHATWLFANTIELPAESPAEPPEATREAAPGGGDGGPPPLRIAVFSPDQIEIEDTWDVAGLRGTGSHHIRADDVVVPAARTLAPMADEPCVDAPLLRIPPPTVYALPMASVALGIARGALDDIVALASDKVPLLEHAPLGTSTPFHVDLAAADTRLRAAAALAYELADELWTCAAEAVPITLEQRARTRAAGVWATQQAVDVATTAFRAGGGSSVYAASPLQRRLRDVNTLAQHFVVKPATLATAGAILAGQDVDVMLF